MSLPFIAVKTESVDLDSSTGDFVSENTITGNPRGMRHLIRVMTSYDVTNKRQIQIQRQRQ